MSDDLLGHQSTPPSQPVGGEQAVPQEFLIEMASNQEAKGWTSDKEYGDCWIPAPGTRGMQISSNPEEPKRQAADQRGERNDSPDQADAMVYFLKTACKHGNRQAEHQSVNKN